MRNTLLKIHTLDPREFTFKGSDNIGTFYKYVYKTIRKIILENNYEQINMNRDYYK